MEKETIRISSEIVRRIRVIKATEGLKTFNDVLNMLLSKYKK